MKRFFSFLAAAAMLFTASCSNEDLGTDGEEAVVSFSMNLDGVSSSKAEIGKGQMVDQLEYAVFEITKDDEGNVTSSTFRHKYEVKKGITFPYTTEIRLAKNKMYRVVFWAQNQDCGAYNVDQQMNVTVDYNGYNNDESRDAFAGYSDLYITGSVEEDVTLVRPFAQLNVGVTNEDWQGALNSGVEMTHSTVTVSKVANTINLFNGEIGANNTQVTYAMAQRPEQSLMVDTNNDGEKEAFHYLSMSYLLVEQNDVQVDFTFSTAAENGHEIALNIPTVPVERNHRTNILGNILTGNVTFRVYIDAEFDGEYNVGGIRVVKTAEELQAALDAAQRDFNPNEIRFGANITGDVTILQKEGVNIVIDGCNYKYDGIMTVNGNARYNGAETLTIQNINFETNSAKTFIDAPSKVNNRYNYSHNITIHNCTFTAIENSAAVHAAVGAKFSQAYGVTMTNCTATNMHTLIQTTSCGTDNIVIENPIVINGKNGVSFTTTKDVVIKNANIEAIGYGIRLEGNAAEYFATISGSTIDAFIPVTVRKMNNDACKLNIKFEGANTLTGEMFDIAICSNEYEEGVAPVAPKGTYTLNGADDFIVYPRDYSTAANVDEFNQALSQFGVIDILSNIDNGTNSFSAGNSVIINMNNNEVKAGGTANSKAYGYIFANNEVVINDANMVGGGIAMNNTKFTFNGGTQKVNYSGSSRYAFYVVGNSEVVIEDGKFVMQRTSCPYFYIGAGSTVYIKGGEFVDKQLANDANKDKLFFVDGGNLIITGGKFQKDPSEWVAEGYVATKDSNNHWVVTKQ